MRLLASVTGHGLGHLAQSALVIQALRAMRPELSLTVWSALARESVAARIAPPFHYHHDADDFGLHMRNSMQIRLRESAEHYEQIHARLDAAIDERARRMERERADVVLANVSYLAVAAAARAGIPALAMCSLNWAHIWAHFFGNRPGAARIHNEMLGAYDRADAFLMPEPSMPMPELAAARPIGPLARVGRARPRALARAAGSHGPIGLVTLRGSDRLAVESWPHDTGWVWLLPAEWGVRHAAARDIEAVANAAGLGFADLVASADMLIAKPGYGTFAEAACNRSRVIFMRRPDWPEQDWLIAWLARHAPCTEVTPQSMRAGPEPGLLAALVARPRGEAVPPSGIEQAAGALARYMA